MKIFDAVMRFLLFIIYLIPTLLGLFLLVVFTWLLGNFYSLFFEVNLTIAYIVTFILLLCVTISSLTTPIQSGGYSPVAYFFLGWLIGRKN